MDQVPSTSCKEEKHRVRLPAQVTNCKVGYFSASVSQDTLKKLLESRTVLACLLTPLYVEPPHTRLPIERNHTHRDTFL